MGCYGSVEFICEDCGNDIVSLGYHDGVEVCYVCRFIRTCPDMPEEMKAKLRGHDADRPPDPRQRN